MTIIPKKFTIYIVFDKFNMTGLNINASNDVYGKCLLQEIISRFRQYENLDDPEQWQVKDIISGIFIDRKSAEKHIEALYLEADNSGSDIDGTEDWYFIREYDVINEEE